MPLLRRSLVCRQAVELVTAYIEGTLSRRDRQRFEAHLADCPHCSEYLAQMRLIVDSARQIRETDLAPEVRDDFIELYRRWRSDPDG